MESVSEVLPYQILQKYDNHLTGLMMNNFCYNYLTFILFSIGFGVTFGGDCGMTANVLIDVVGLPKFIQGWGIQLFFMGIGLMIGPPIVGKRTILP